MMMRIENLSLALFLIFTIDMFSLGSAQLRPNYYANICPNVENIVRNAVTTKFQQTFATVPSTIRLFYHDCFVQGCDASIVVASTPGHKAEKDHPENLSIAGDGFDTVIKAKAAVDAVPECRNKVSCADILAMATRDVIALAGGPSYAVELGRLDGLSSTSKSVTGKLPKPEFDLNQLNSLFAANGLSQTDMIALSAAHTVGFSHCSFFAKRIQNPIAPTLNKTYGAQLQTLCQQNPNPNLVLPMDSTSNTFDNQYFKDLQQGRGLFNSDQSLFTDSRSRPTVNTWAQNSAAFNEAFITAITKMGRIGVKTGSEGNIRKDCAVFN